MVKYLQGKNKISLKLKRMRTSRIWRKVKGGKLRLKLKRTSDWAKLGASDFEWSWRDENRLRFSFISPLGLSKGGAFTRSVAWNKAIHKSLMRKGIVSAKEAGYELKGGRLYKLGFQEYRDFIKFYGNHSDSRNTGMGEKYLMQVVKKWFKANYVFFQNGGCEMVLYYGHNKKYQIDNGKTMTQADLTALSQGRSFNQFWNRLLVKNFFSIGGTSGQMPTHFAEYKYTKLVITKNQELKGKWRKQF